MYSVVQCITHLEERARGDGGLDVAAARLEGDDGYSLVDKGGNPYATRHLYLAWRKEMAHFLLAVRCKHHRGSRTHQCADVTDPPTPHSTGVQKQHVSLTSSSACRSLDC